MTLSFKGDASNFDQNWSNRKEANYLHWSREEPINQIQLAFRNHWFTFSRILRDNKVPVAKSLEVGCGRGSLSAYFADNGWETSLLDLSSTVIDKARKAFLKENLNGNFVEGNCLKLPFDKNTFDCIFSIGLFEHFEDILPVAAQQFEVLRPGGICFAYVVPEKVTHVQADFEWINNILKSEVNNDSNVSEKQPIFRSAYKAEFYKSIFKNCGFTNINSSGIYSMPMISNSVDFPFTLLKPKSELELVKFLSSHLDARLSQPNVIDPWLCDEDYGHAFLVWATKP